MIEILQRDDYSQVQDEKLKSYLTYSFQRLPKDFQYPEYGYFVIIEDIKEIEKPLTLTTYIISPLQIEFFEYVELVEEKDGVVEIVLLLDNDFGVSLMIRRDILDDGLYQQLCLYKVSTGE
jgi:hypothetical protein